MGGGGISTIPAVWVIPGTRQFSSLLFVVSGATSTDNFLCLWTVSDRGGRVRIGFCN